MRRADNSSPRAPAAPPTVDALGAAVETLLGPFAALLAPLVAAHLAPHLRGSAPAEIPQLATKQQLATMLAVSTAGIDRGCREGWLPFLLVGDVRRFDPAVVRAALEARTAAQRTAGDSRTGERDDVPETRPSGVRRLGRGAP